MSNKHSFLETEKITKLLIKFSLPAIIGMVVNALYNIVDRIYIGNIKEIGHIAIAGVGLSFPVIVFTFAFALLIGMGSGAAISLKLGEKKQEEAEKILGVGLFYSVLIAIILMVILYSCMDKLIILLGGSDETFIYAKQYLSIILLGTIGIIAGNTMNTVIRSDGSPKYSMLSLIMAAGVNIILDPIFIFYFNMGVRGAAIATIISQYIYMGVTFYYFRSKYSRLKLNFHYVRFNFDKIKRISILGSSIFAIQLGFTLITYFLNNILKKYGGDISIAAMAVIQAIVSFMTMPVFGINQGLQPIVGYNYGAQKYRRTKEALYKAVFGATCICLTGFLGVRFFGDELVSLFTQNVELKNLAIYGLKIYTLAFPIIGFQIVSSIYFQAIGKPKISFFISLSRQIIIMIPCLFILARFYGLKGVWYATPLADTISTILTFILVRREMKSLKKLENNLERAN